VQQALSDAHLTPADIGKVLLVGGTTRIPAVRETVRRLMGQEPSGGLNPDECVAMGAALQAGVLSGTVKGLLLVDVAPLTLGIETMGGIFSPIIPRNTTIPVKKSAVYTTAANFQPSVEIKVFQGERQMTRGNKLLGNFKLTGIARAPRGVPQIEVTFEIDASGIVHVSARDKDTGCAQAITITASSNLSQSEIERAVIDAQVYAAEDAARRKEAAARDAAEALLLKAGAVNRKELPKEQRRALDAAERQLRRAIRGKDAEKITDASRQLQQTLETCKAGQP
jgi:molecular chaperone DnaK